MYKTTHTDLLLSNFQHTCTCMYNVHVHVHVACNHILPIERYKPSDDLDPMDPAAYSDVARSEYVSHRHACTMYM